MSTQQSSLSVSPRSSREADAYTRLLSMLASRTPFDRVARAAAEEAQALLEAEGASVTRATRDEVAYVAASGRATPVVGRTMSKANSFTGKVLDGQTAAIFERDVAKEPSKERASKDQIQSGVVAPIVVAGRSVGTLGVMSTQSGAFNGVSVRVLEGLARVLAVGLERADTAHRAAEAERFASLGDLAVSFAHDIRSPLTVLKGNLELMTWELDELTAGTPVTARVRADLVAMLREMQTAVERLTETTRRVRDYSRFDQADGPHIEANVSDELRRAASLVRARVELVAGFSIDVPDDLPRVRLIENRLSEVVVHLLTNAAEAIPEPTGADDAATRRHRVALEAWHDAGMVGIRVQDTGRGIPEDQLDRIFQPFYTLKRSEDCIDIHAAGLGLWTVWRVATDVGGNVRVDSTPGRGTTVELTLPAV